MHKNIRFFLTLLAVMLVAVIFMSNHQNDSTTGLFHSDSGFPILVTKFEPRSSLAIEHINGIDNLISDYDLKIQWVLIPSRECSLTLMSKPIIRSIEPGLNNLKDNTSTFLGLEEASLYQVSSLEPVGKLRDFVLDYLNHPIQKLTDDFIVGENIKNGPLSFFSETKLSESPLEYVLLFLVEDICFYCPSGSKLAFLEELSRDFLGIEISAITVKDVSPEILNRFINDNNITVPITVAPEEFRNYWFSSLLEFNYVTHPLHEEFLIVGKDGFIIFRDANKESLGEWATINLTKRPTQ